MACTADSSAVFGGHMRGVGGVGAKNMAQNLIDGHYFAGQGWYGGGTYSGYGGTQNLRYGIARAYAEQKGKNPETRAFVRFGIKEGTKTIEHRDADKLYHRERDKILVPQREKMEAELLKTHRNQYEYIKEGTVSREEYAAYRVRVAKGLAEEYTRPRDKEPYDWKEFTPDRIDQEIAWRADGKIKDYADMRAKEYLMSEDIDYLIRFGDLSQFLALEGYQATTIPGQSYHVLLDRTASFFIDHPLTQAEITAGLKYRAVNGRNEIVADGSEAYDWIGD